MRSIRCLLFCLTLFCVQTTYSKELFRQENETACLSNIQQLTSPEMGFRKAEEARFSPDGLHIIFKATTLEERGYQIYTMDLEHSNPVMVSTGKGSCSSGFFRPDGKKIIFASSDSSPDNLKAPPKNPLKHYVWELTPYMNIYEANLDGSELTALTFGPAYHAECSYSPDGSRIVYASNESGEMHLYIMNTDGFNPQCITSVGSCRYGNPLLSQNGEEMIFHCDRGRPNYLQLYRMNSDGSNEEQLMHNGAVNWAPCWHPNGKIIAYTTSLHGRRHCEIYLLNIETMVTYRLTHNSSFDGLPSFNHDGTKLLWTSKRAGKSEQIFIADFTMPNELE